MAVRDALYALEDILSFSAALCDPARLNERLAAVGERPDPVALRARQGPRKAGFRAFETERAFYKERCVARPGGDPFDRGAAADLYAHLRAFVAEREGGCRPIDLCVVPAVHKVYAYWDREGYWVGAEQERLPEDRSAHALLRSAHEQGGVPAAEAFARTFLADACGGLARLQTHLFLAHNDLHLRNVYVRHNGAAVLADFDRASFCVAPLGGGAPVAHQSWWYMLSSPALRDAFQLVAELVGVLEAHAQQDRCDAPFARRLREKYLDGVNVRRAQPSAVFLGVCAEGAPTARALGAANELETGPNAAWILMERAARCLTTRVDAWETVEYAALRRAPPPRPGAGHWERGWTLRRVRDFVEAWVHHALALFWAAPGTEFSAASDALAPAQRTALFVQAQEGAQRAFALFNDAQAINLFGAGDDPFAALHACHVAVHGQSPLALARDEALRAQSGDTIELARRVRSALLATEDAARERLACVGAVRRLLGTEDLDRLVNAQLFRSPAVDHALLLHVSLALLHPDALYAYDALTPSTLRELVTHSRQL